MKTALFLILVVFASFICLEGKSRYLHPDVGLNVKRLIKKYGYPLEIHNTVTEDGYKLELHRIPRGRNNIEVENQPVAFLMPGTLCSSADWVNMGPEKSLGFILADKGYDVWLGNYRGTTWSRKHVTLDPKEDKKQFWDFSFHEIGYYDAPALIDYALNATKQEKLFYVGHSQGTTSFYVMTSMRPEYNSKIRLMGALSPVIYTENLRHPIPHILAPNVDKIQEMWEKNGIYELWSHSPSITIYGQLFCNDDSVFQNLCAAGLFLISGYSPENLNKTMIPVITSNTPAGSATKQYVHFAQLLNSKKFQQFDYGEEENLIKYGQATPPEYDLNNIVAPVALYYSDNDWLVAEEDVERAANGLPNVAELRLIKGYNHLDYMWGIHAARQLYDPLIALMEQY